MSIPSSPNGSLVKTRDGLIRALLRVPAQAIHRRFIKELNAAGRYVRGAGTVRES